MQRKQKGEQFRVLDSARAEKPVKPDMKKLFALIVGAGLAVGAGIIFVLEYLDNSFKRPEEIESESQASRALHRSRIISRRTRIGATRRTRAPRFGLACVVGPFYRFRRPLEKGSIRPSTPEKLGQIIESQVVMGKFDVGLGKHENGKIQNNS